MGDESELKDDKSDEGGKNCYEVSGIWVHVVISKNGIIYGEGSIEVIMRTGNAERVGVLKELEICEGRLKQCQERNN